MTSADQMGFTLIEMVVVLAVLAVITAIAVPALRLPTRPATSDIDEVRELVEAVRAEAMRRPAVLRLVLDQRSDRWWVFDPDHRPVAAGRVAFQVGTSWIGSEPRAQLHVSASGAINGDDLSLILHDGTRATFRFRGRMSIGLMEADSRTAEASQ